VALSFGSTTGIDGAGRVLVARCENGPRNQLIDLYGNLRRYLKQAGLPLGGVHLFRHSAAKLRRDAGETIEDFSRFLDHSNLATTTTYLRRLEGETDKSWAKVALAIGV
jgi:integrase